LNRRQLHQRRFGLDDLALEMRDLLDAFLRDQLQAVFVARPASASIIRLISGQREAELLALEDSASRSRSALLKIRRLPSRVD